MKFFGEKTQEKRLAHVLKKYAKLADSDSFSLLSNLPKQEFWRFFIDGIYQNSTRGIRAAFVQLHGEKTLSNKIFLSMSINAYSSKYNQASIHQLLQNKLHLNKYKYKKFLRAKLNNGNATIREVLLLDQAWIAFEINEPRYLTSVFKAFFSSIQSDFPLSIDLIQNIHALLGAKVKGTNYDFSLTHPGEFRKKPYIAYGLETRNTSIQGLKEMLRRRNKINHFFIRIHDKYANTYCNIVLDHDFIVNARNHIVSGFIRMSKDGSVDDSPFDPDINPLDAAILDIFTQICRTNSSHDIANVIYSLLDGTFQLQSLSIDCCIYFANKISHINAPDYYQTELQRLIDAYHSDIDTAATPLAKLRVIVTFIQQCEQLHPFEDMNCRLFCMVLLNYLLAKNGYPYVIQADPNRFDLYGIDELIDEMITGMNKTFELLAKKAVYGVDTKKFLTSLKSSSTHHSTYYAEFKKALAMIELNLNEPSNNPSAVPKYNH